MDPATGEPYRLTFPELSLEDVANAAYEAVTHALGITQLDFMPNGDPVAYATEFAERLLPRLTSI